MRKRKFILIGIGVLVFTLLAGTVALAAVNYDIEPQVVSTGGGERASDNYMIRDVAGESAVGISQSQNYLLRAGFPLPAVVPSPTPTQRLEGDIHPLGSGNGIIDSADFQLVAQHIIWTITLTGDDFLAADVNDSGTIDSADLQLVAQYLIGTITAFPGGTYIP
ncbi:MAG TPA: dockerin type I repeat-containing protein [Dehalococcoidia bacterium]|nr:dockerin type I repeat-containing protein [Dehalococcoidia bacterium]